MKKKVYHQFKIHKRRHLSLWLKGMLGFAIAFFFTCAQTRAQEIVVSGTVTTTANEALPGVNVVIQGTTQGTVTDIDGNYRLTVPDANTVLVFSFIGYATKEVPVNNRSVIDVSLEEDVEQLDELVVIGYGTEQRRNLTSAIATIESEEITSTPNSNAMQSLQGKVAGVQINSSGAPGSSPTVRIRGVGTFGDNAEPLYVVDGMFLDNIDFINPQTIETISVLKDAAASAIYGVRAANGVVIIETKSGNYEQPVQINYNGYYGVQVPQNVLKMANTQQFASYINQTGIEAEQALIDNAISRFGRSRIDPSLPVTNTDWYNEVLVDAAPIQNHSLSISGGSKKARFSVGASYFGQDGLMDHMPNNYERINFNAKVDVIATDWLTVGGNAIISNATQFNAEDAVWFQSYYAIPTLPVYDEQNTAAEPDAFGNAQLFGYRSRQNPFFVLANNNNRNKIGKILGNFYADIQIIPDMLSFKTSYNIFYQNIIERKVDFAYDDGVTEWPNGLTRKSATDHNTIWNNVLTYSDFFGGHGLTVTAGYSYRSEIYEGVQARAQEIRTLFRNEEENWYIPKGSELDPEETYDFGEKFYGSSYFGRVSYDFKGKYLLSGSYRKDGTNKFSEKWGNFFTVSGGWVLSEESFFNVNGIDFLKIRGGWGQMGNDGIDPAIGQTTFDQVSIAIDDQLVTGVSPDNVFDLIDTWETVVGTNIGLTGRFLNNRLSLEANIYRRDTEDAVLNVTQRGTGEAPRRNAGSIRNQGLELALGWEDNINENFSYNVSANFSALHNEVLDVGDQPFLDAGTAEFRQRSQPGYSLREFYGYEIIGVFQTEEEVANSGYTEEFIANNNLVPGDFYFRDQNDDGEINADDRAFLGSYIPSYTFGFNLGFTYKGLSFSAYVQGQGGNKILNRRRGEIIFTQDRNIDAELATSFWSGPGTTNEFPSAKGYRKPYNNNQLSEFLLEDGDYFRIQNVRISYVFNDDQVLGIPLPQTTVFLTAERPLTFFDYNGFTPEVADGVDRQTYPIPAIYTVGLNLKF